MEEIEKDMTPILLEDLGMRYPTESSKERKRYGLYQCQYCQKEFETRTQSVKVGLTKSCGCHKIKISKLQGKANITHGLSNHPLYYIWGSMKARCYNETHISFNSYLGKGIQVCLEWRSNFMSFYIWAIENGWKQGLTLDRINNDGDYTPDNCRWVNRNIQQRNKRIIQRNNTSGYKGVYFNAKEGKWNSRINCNNIGIPLGCYKTALEAAKAYEIYVRINNLEHNFTPALTEDELDLINSFQQYLVSKNKSVTKMYKSFVTLLLI